MITAIQQYRIDLLLTSRLVFHVDISASTVVDNVCSATFQQAVRHRFVTQWFAITIWR